MMSTEIRLLVITGPSYSLIKNFYEEVKIYTNQRITDSKFNPDIEQNLGNISQTDDYKSLDR